jgi:hypothetical protein
LRGEYHIQYDEATRAGISTLFYSGLVFIIRVDYGVVNIV